MRNVCLQTYRKNIIGKNVPYFLRKLQNLQVNNSRILKINFKKKKTLWPLFMDGVQLPQGLSHFEEAVYFLPLKSE